jgi:hypothetical protein
VSCEVVALCNWRFVTCSEAHLLSQMLILIDDNDDINVSNNNNNNWPRDPSIHPMALQPVVEPWPPMLGFVIIRFYDMSY